MNAAKSRPTLLLVAGDLQSQSAIQDALGSDFECLTADDSTAACGVMADHFVQVLLCDDSLPDRQEFLSHTRQTWPETIQIILADTGRVPHVADQADVYQVIAKPLQAGQLLQVVRNAAALFQLTRDRDRLVLEMRVLGDHGGTKLENRRQVLRDAAGFDKLLRAANSPVNLTIETARQYASFDVPVLITGEAGTGKQMLAQAMHNSSLRANQSFFTLDCAGMTDDMLQVELLGAKRGALAGLPGHKIGLFQRADRGTLFLNGIDTLSPQMQVILLRVLTEGVFQPLGGHDVQTTNLRIMTGAHRDLGEMRTEGTFRDDLYYAVAATELVLPPLRARRDDLAILAQHMLFDLAAAHSKPIQGISDLAIEFLANYDWPGNLREFENELTRMLIFARDPVLGPELISRHILQSDPFAMQGEPAPQDQVLTAGTLKDRVENVEIRVLRETLTRLKWNKSKAASELGLSRVGLRAKLDRYGITQPVLAMAEEE